MGATGKEAGERRGRPRNIRLSELHLDERCKVRAEINPEVVDEYAEIYKAGGKLPPIEVFKVGGENFVVNGWHRDMAATKAELDSLSCRIVGEGTFEEATWYAASTNQGHGLRRSNSDKRKAVMMAIECEVGSKQSSRTIAEHIGVSHDFVSRVRKEVEEAGALSSDDNAPAKKVTTKDGREYPKQRKAPRAQSKNGVKEPEPEPEVEELDEIEDGDGAQKKIPPKRATKGRKHAASEDETPSHLPHMDKNGVVHPPKTTPPGNSDAEVVLANFIDFVRHCRRAFKFSADLNAQAEGLEESLRQLLQRAA